MKLNYNNGLLMTSVTVTFKGRSKEINNIVVDTGATHTLISIDSVEDIGIAVSRDDEIVTAFGIGGEEYAFTKRLDSIELGGFKQINKEIDFTSIPYSGINGLLGLDILIEGGFKIDLKTLEMHTSCIPGIYNDGGITFKA